MKKLKGEPLHLFGNLENSSENEPKTNSIKTLLIILGIVIAIYFSAIAAAILWD